jgi:hypothetical protein
LADSLGKSLRIRIVVVVAEVEEVAVVVDDVPKIH